jgi:hypothetical protein
MAICSKCGEMIPDGAAFCTNCGAPVAGAPLPQTFASEESTISTWQKAAAPREPAFRPQAPSFPPREPAFQAQQGPDRVNGREEPPAKKKNLKLPLIIGGAVLLVALVLGVLFLTGVLGGGPGPEGVWILSDPGSSGMKAGDIVLELAEDGTGTARVKGRSQPLTWTKNSLTIRDETAGLKLKGEELILEEEDGVRYVFRREGAAEAAPVEAGLFGSEPAASVEEPVAAPVEAPAAEPVAEPVAEPEAPASESPVNTSGEGPYWNLPSFTYSSGKSFPFGPWGGVYVYNGWFFKTYFQLNEDYTCTRTIYRDGVVVADEQGIFEYENKKIKLYMNGDRNTWTEYAVDGEMMVNNNHEFFRQDPGGLIGAWVGDYYYNNKHIHTTYILRTDGTYSEVTFRDEEKVTDNEGTWSFDGSTLKLKATDTPNITTPFDYKDGVLINNNYKYWRS